MESRPCRWTDPLQMIDQYLNEVISRVMKRLFYRVRSSLFVYLLSASTMFMGGLCLSVQAADAGHGDHPATGRKIASPGPDDVEKFLKIDQEAKHVVFPLTATFNDVNHGMNFNGHCKGRAVYTVPKGWKVTFEFKNMSPVPHSAVVVEAYMARKLQVGEPYFDGASTTDPLKGLKKEEKFTFEVDEAGKFAVACGFPAHSASGHWLTFNVSKDAKVPSIEFPKHP